MKFYYTLTCVILPIGLIAACTASGPKNTTPTNTTPQIELSQHQSSDSTIAKEVKTMKKGTVNIEPKPAVTIAEKDKFPLIPIESSSNTATTAVTKPSKRTYQFAFNKQEMEQKDLDSLQAHAEYLNNNPDAVLTVNGHSDTQGNTAYNKLLSYERANKIAKFLIASGAPKDQIIVNGMGDKEPLYDINNFEENRRVELEYSESRLAIK